MHKKGNKPVGMDISNVYPAPTTAFDGREEQGSCYRNSVRQPLPSVQLTKMLYGLRCALKSLRMRNFITARQRFSG